MVMRKTRTDVDKLVMNFAEAKELRNGLYKYRLLHGSALFIEFSNFNMLQLARVLKVSGRDYELFSPLIFLCQKYRPEWMDGLKDYIVHYQEIKKTMEENTMEASIMLALYYIIDEKNRPDKTANPLAIDKWEGHVGLAEITEMLMRIESDYANISSKSMGRALQRLGFLQSKRICGKRYRYIDGKAVLDYLQTNEIDYQFKPRTRDEVQAMVHGQSELDLETYNWPPKREGEPK